GTAAGTTTLDFAPVNDAPTVVGESLTLAEDTVANFTSAALLANDSDVDNAHTDLSITAVQNAHGGSVSLDASGGIVFTPTQDFNGPSSFDYLVSDGASGVSVATVNLNYTPVNDAPTVVGETFAGQEDQAVTFTSAALLANDSDVDNPH